MWRIGPRKYRKITFSWGYCYKNDLNNYIVSTDMNLLKIVIKYFFLEVQFLVHKSVIAKHFVALTDS